MIQIKIECDRVKVGAKSNIGLMVELTAPASQATEIETSPRGVVFVVDRSGSMGGGRLELVKTTILDILGRLKKTDYLAVVSFDHQVDVAVPMTKIADVDIKTLRQKISAMQPGGNTNLEQGYRYGLAEAASAPSGVEVQVILLSDGQANSGVCDPNALGQLAAAATEHLISTSTLGIGRDYDEKILVAMSNTGRGNHFAAVDQNEAALGLNSEIDELLTRTVSDLKITFKKHGHFETQGFIKAHTAATQSGRVQKDDFFAFADLGDSEERNYLFELTYDAQPPFMSDLAGTIKILVEYTDLTTGQPVSARQEFVVFLANADHWVEPARDEDIVMELATIRAQEAKEEAMHLMREGFAAEARALLMRTGHDLALIEEMSQDLSPRNRMRAQRYAREFTELSDFDGDEFIKRTEESLKRTRESKRDPRKPIDPKAGN